MSVGGPYTFFYKAIKRMVTFATHAVPAAKPEGKLLVSPDKGARIMKFVPPNPFASGEERIFRTHDTFHVTQTLRFHAKFHIKRKNTCHGITDTMTYEGFRKKHKSTALRIYWDISFGKVANTRKHLAYRNSLRIILRKASANVETVKMGPGRSRIIPDDRKKNKLGPRFP